AAFLRVPQRLFIRALSQPNRQGSNSNAAGVEHLQRVDEPLPFLSQEVRGGDPAAFEYHFARIACPHAELVFFLPWPHAGRAVFDNEGRDAAMSLATIGDRH